MCRSSTETEWQQSVRRRGQSTLLPTPMGCSLRRPSRRTRPPISLKSGRFIFGRPTSTPLDTRQDVKNASPFWDAEKERPQHRIQTSAERESRQRSPRHLRVRHASHVSTNGLIGLSQNGYRKLINMLRRGGLLVMLNTLFPFPSFCRLILLKSLLEQALPLLMLPHRLRRRRLTVVTCPLTRTQITTTRLSTTLPAWTSTSSTVSRNVTVDPDLVSTMPYTFRKGKRWLPTLTGRRCCRRWRSARVG